MWNPTDHRYSYEAARSEEGAASADELTLNGEEDLPLSPEELAFADPLDEKNQARLAVKSLHRKPMSLLTKVQHWVTRPQAVSSGPTSQPREVEEPASEEAGRGLLEKDGSTTVPRWSAVAKHTVSWVVWPLPSFTHRFFIHTAPEKEVRRPTDYLDGMRGVASLFVFFDHYFGSLYYGVMSHGFGDENNWNIFELPFIKVIYGGGAMVAIFFVISGYVLSQRCIVAMRADKQDKLHNALTSMTFRRAIRLFLPSMAISFLTLLVSLTGLLPPPQINWTLWTELHRYWRYLIDDLFKIWVWEVSFKGWYGTQLWTIPFEFKCSMALFIFILVVARCKVHVRFALEAVVFVYLLYCDRWDVATFLAGMVIAELNINHDERKKARENLDVEPSFAPRRGLFQHILRALPFWIVFFVGFYLIGYPIEDAGHTPGYDFLSQFWQADWEYKRRFWWCLGACMMVFATSFVKHLKLVFTTPIARYLGKISYALYLVHALLNRTVRLFLWATFWNVLQYETEEGDDAKFDGGWIMGTLIYFPIVFWFADIFWRAVDIPSVKFAKWVEGKCFKEEKQA